MIVIAGFLMTSCSKQSRGADDLVPHQLGVEDNVNGGGGNNTVSVPAAVLSAFNARYPDATNVQWKKQSDGTYKAEFLRGFVRWQATFTPAGVLVKEEHN